LSSINSSSSTSTIRSWKKNNAHKKKESEISVSQNNRKRRDDDSAATEVKKHKFSFFPLSLPQANTTTMLNRNKIFPKLLLDELETVVVLP
jgi:hypothetical protein